MKALLIILMFFCYSSHAQRSILEKRSNGVSRIEMRVKKEKNRVFEGMLVGYGALFVVANFSKNTKNFMIPAFAFTAIGITSLIKNRKRKHGVQCI